MRVREAHRESEEESLASRPEPEEERDNHPFSASENEEEEQVSEEEGEKKRQRMEREAPGDLTETATDQATETPGERLAKEVASNMLAVATGAQEPPKKPDPMANLEEKTVIRWEKQWKYYVLMGGKHKAYMCLAAAADDDFYMVLIFEALRGRSLGGMASRFLGLDLKGIQVELSKMSDKEILKMLTVEYKEITVPQAEVKLAKIKASDKSGGLTRHTVEDCRMDCEEYCVKFFLEVEELKKRKQALPSDRVQVGMMIDGLAGASKKLAKELRSAVKNKTLLTPDQLIMQVYEVIERADKAMREARDLEDTGMADPRPSGDKGKPKGVGKFTPRNGRGNDYRPSHSPYGSGHTIPHNSTNLSSTSHNRHPSRMPQGRTRGPDHVSGPIRAAYPTTAGGPSRDKHYDSAKPEYNPEEKADMAKLKGAGACIYYGVGRKCFKGKDCPWKHVLVKDL